MTAGMYVVGTFGHDDNWTRFLPGMIIDGVGLGSLTAVNQAASLTFASQENAGMSSATFGTLRQIGMATGIAGLGAVFSHVAQNKAESGVAAIPEIDALNSMAVLGTVIGAVSVVIAVIAFAIDHGRTRRCASAR
ncbi:hypothetical protein ABZ815_46970 [Nonomuraea sp. NPDC047529]|uniref:hypothetical protein n=1 Tax=Nonomuraea sp. NPDC047529 TaxID=3155623 RepID=UPI0033CF4737